MANAPPDLRALQEAAAGACLAHATSVLGGPLTVAIDASSAAWSPLWLRHVLEQRMTISRPVVDVEVILDAAERVVGFVDHGAPAPSAWRELTDAEVMTALVSTGLMATPLTLQSRGRAPDGMLAIVASGPARTITAPTHPRRGTVTAREPGPEIDR